MSSRPSPKLRTSIRTRLTLSHLAVIVVAMGLSGFLLLSLLERYFLEAMEDKPVILCIGLKDGEDIFALYEKLKDAGVKMHTSEVELRETEGRIFFCEDPEGYVVEITQRPK